jgi:2-polyprenyl-3-methyl-5-hydroxy-6-metoxy-1,4-benzoquinol methylase
MVCPMVDEKKLRERLIHIAERFSDDLRMEQVKDVPRIAFNIQMCIESLSGKISPTICDIGGGVGLFSVGCAASGFSRVLLIDDFGDAVNRRYGDSVLDLHRSFGVEILSRDAVEGGISDLDCEFDVITSFDSMEHWHNSPKTLFHQVVRRIRPGGLFILGGPNAVNLRKRLSVPFGKGKWSSMREWYEEDRFRGHVREPDVDDLLYIASDMGLTNVKIVGRNWNGHKSDSSVVRFSTRLLDWPARMVPRICSDIYMIGRRPG